MIRVGFFLGIFLATHEQHMLEEVCQSLPLWRVVEAPDVDGYGTVRHGIALGEFLLVVVLDKQDLNTVLQRERFV